METSSTYITSRPTARQVRALPSPPPLPTEMPPSRKLEPPPTGACSKNYSKDLPAQEWPLAKLKPHPKQPGLFQDLNDADFQRLIKSLEADGQREPIEILPDGTIISGHQRVNAARQLEWNQINAIVRGDLSHKPDEVEKRLIEVNRQRRQLSSLDQVRCEIRLHELSHPNALRWEVINHLHNAPSLDGKGKGGCATSKKHLGRLYDIAKASMALQRAVNDGIINQVKACMLAKLSEAKQQSIVEEIRNGGDINYLLKKHGCILKSPSKDPILEALIRCAERCVNLENGEPAANKATCLSYDEGLKVLSNLTTKKIMERKKAKSLAAKSARGVKSKPQKKAVKRSSQSK